MNVSSVKNLNGETFSAVQDATLTNVVQSNSATWSQGGNPEVESYVQTNSGTIDDTVTSYQTNSGTFLTAHQAISAEEWNDCYDNVNTNSGAWGGSALPISAGPGIKVNLVDNTLVFSNDETVLWSGTLASGATAALSEPITAFERIGFAGYCHNGEVYSVYAEAPVISTAVRIAATTFWPGSPEFDLVKCECANTTAKSYGTSILYNGSTTNTNGTITKIVGIGRKDNT